MSSVAAQMKDWRHRPEIEVDIDVLAELARRRSAPNEAIADVLRRVVLQGADDDCWAGEW